jgi:processive 1,2-diacylglycerol beta-glucosyltransferase
VRALIVSASMGAGHDGAAYELQRRLEAGGHDARVVDLLDAPPFRLGGFFRFAYVMQLRYAPWAYELTYRLWYWLGILIAPVTMFINVLAGRRIMQWIRDYQPDVVVSTYPLASLALGRRRQRGQLSIPVVTYVTDFAVHPLLVHRAVDLHLCVHAQSAAKAAARVSGAVRAPGPLVQPRFVPTSAGRARARRRVGLRPDERAVLIVAGSWGVGDVIEAFDVLSSSDRYTPVVVCGRNARLAEQLRGRGTGHVIEWTDEMDVLMRACDAIVQNAGGLTCMEAFASGLPVVSFRPIPGHGLENAGDMERAGVAAYVRDPAQLVSTLDDVTGPSRAAMTAAGRAMFAGDAAVDVIDAASARVPAPVLAPLRTRPRRSRVAAGVAAAAAFYASFTLGVGVAAAHGVGVSRPSRGSDNVFFAVRLSADNARNSAVGAALSRLSASAVVDGDLARQDPEAIAQLRRSGIDVVNGGAGRRNLFVSGRRVNGYDLVAARLAHERVVVASTVMHPGDNEALRLRARGIYVVDGRNTDPDTLVHLLDELASQAAGTHVVPAPLSHL